MLVLLLIDEIFVYLWEALDHLRSLRLSNVFAILNWVRTQGRSPHVSGKIQKYLRPRRYLAKGTPQRLGNKLLVLFDVKPFSFIWSIDVCSTTLKQIMNLYATNEPTCKTPTTSDNVEEVSVNVRWAKIVPDSSCFWDFRCVKIAMFRRKGKTLKEKQYIVMLLALLHCFSRSWRHPAS